VKLRTRVAERAGFTLVEIMVTLLIVGGIMVSVTQILQAARLSRDTIHNLQETQLTGPAVLDLIERDLRALVAYDLPKPSILRVKNRVVSGLDADALDFVASTDSLLGFELDNRLVRSDWGEVGYRCRVRPDDDDFLELYRREGLGVDEEPFEGGSWVFLSDRVKQFDIQVYYEDGPDAEPKEGFDAAEEKPSILQWGGKKIEETGLPVRLEISLTLELAPRLVREQIRFLSNEKRLVTYKRVVRMPQSLFGTLVVGPTPRVPEITKPSDPNAPAK
jgi:prepilin-type N-terminal cleavage/methylation domain-containing protein